MSKYTTSLNAATIPWFELARASFQELETASSRGIVFIRGYTDSYVPLPWNIYSWYAIVWSILSCKSSASFVSARKGSEHEENAYIMNLQSCIGYIDGLSIKSQHYDGEKMDMNHSACGHLVNHHAHNHNAAVYPFSWSEVLEHNETVHNATRGGNEDLFSLPNEMRLDGSPWYYDEIEGEITRFPTTRDKSPPLPLSNQLFGAALVLTSPVSKGGELLLDYCLQEPLPKWAKDWYTS